MYKNSLIRKVNFKIYDVTAWLTIEIHILLNISRSKRNQTIEFGQLIKYNIVNTVVEKSYTKCGGENIPCPFSKKSKLSLSIYQWSQIFMLYVFLVC